MSAGNAVRPWGYRDVFSVAAGEGRIEGDPVTSGVAVGANAIITSHARQRIASRSKLSTAEIQDIISRGLAVELQITERGVFHLFWSDRDQVCQVAITDPDRRKIITIFTDRMYEVSQAPISDELKERVRSLVEPERVVIKKFPQDNQEGPLPPSRYLIKALFRGRHISWRTERSRHVRLFKFEVDKYPGGIQSIFDDEQARKIIAERIALVKPDYEVLVALLGYSGNTGEPVDLTGIWKSWTDQP